MNVLLITEHYFPKVGGTVSYVENTAINLAKKGINVFLLVPSIGKLGEISVINHSEQNLSLLNLGVTDRSLHFDARERSYLCNWIHNNVTEITTQYNIQIVHLLFGLFIAEALNTAMLKKMGIKTFNTIHNVPPFECSNSWKGDHLLRYYKDVFRKIGVKLINKRRIIKNKFDIYITPSQIVKETLSSYVPETKIKVIGHGGAEYFPNITKQPFTNGVINLLTVGGLVPHKNQHLIPQIAAHLINKGIKFKWDIVGPIRNQRYFNSIKNEISELGLEEFVFIRQFVNNVELDSFYKKSNLYIQLSSEEGFCMTVLDAIAYKTPVLATPAGAIPEMLDLVDGTLIENNPSSLKTIITHYIKIVDSLTINDAFLLDFKKKYTWSNATEQLIQIYNE